MVTTITLFTIYKTLHMMHKIILEIKIDKNNL